MNAPALRLALTAFGLASLVALELPAQTDDQAAMGQFVQAGCGVCHGELGRGGPAGPSLTTGELALADFIDFVRHPVRSMPAYAADAVSDESLEEMHAALQAGPQTVRPDGDRETGAELYAEFGCYSCHANEAQGGMHGPRLGPDPISFARFSWYVRQPTATMPPYSPIVVTADELADIYAFLEAQPAPPPLDSIPLLSP